MTMPNQKELFYVEFAKLCMVFDKANSKEKADVYLDDLQGLPAAEIVAAVREARRNSEYMPRPVHIRKLCVSEPDQASLAGEAWLLVLAAANRSELPEDPRARAAAHACGLDGPTMGRMQGDTIEVFERPRFLKAYAALADTSHAAKQIEAPRSRVEQTEEHRGLMDQIEEHQGLPDEAKKAIASVLGR